ncbi:MAG: pyridoxal phosphate-dependent aminotransferase [Spirochaetia bacterium]
MKLADRFSRLGTETAFAVAAEAQRHAQQGARVFPFHLGDIDIKTPQNIIEATHRAMKDGKTGYCSNYGITELRDALAEQINHSHRTSYSGANVAIEPGGKPVIQKFFLSLMNPGDEALIPAPGYPIYESIVAFHGGKPVLYPYREGPAGFSLDLDDLEKRITPATRFLVFNDLQNPTGAEEDERGLAALSKLVLRHNLLVLCDEAYFDIRYAGRSQSLVSLPGMEERCLVLYTFSKKYAMTGWRLGAAVGPRDLVDGIAKLNVNDESCSNHFVQYGGLEALTGPQDGAQAILRTLQQRRDRSHELLSAIPGMRCHRPNATFYLFPNVTAVMQQMGFDQYEDFRRAALEATGVSFCTRLHFGTPLPEERERYIRLSYSGIEIEGIEEGLQRLRSFAAGEVPRRKVKNA